MTFSKISRVESGRGWTRWKSIGGSGPETFRYHGSDRGTPCFFLSNSDMAPNSPRRATVRGSLVFAYEYVCDCVQLYNSTASCWPPAPPPYYTPAFPRFPALLETVTPSTQRAACLLSCFRAIMLLRVSPGHTNELSSKENAHRRFHRKPYTEKNERRRLPAKITRCMYRFSQLYYCVLFSSSSSL